MGILNLTPDSFSDGGKYNAKEAALARCKDLTSQGATILDIGAESTRPGAEQVSAAEELDRLLPVLRELPKDQFLISVDSCKLEVQAEAMIAGAHIINDIYGGSDELFSLAGKHQCGLVLMHTPGSPQEMQSMTDYGGEDIVDVVAKYFETKHNALANSGIPRYWVDPGIGFGKTPQQSLRLMGHISRFCGSGHGVLVGASRKSWIGKSLGAPLEERLGASLAAALYAARHGADILRVHDVQETVQALAAERLLGTDAPCPGKLMLENIQVRTTIGIHEEEKVTEQGILVSVELSGDFSKVVSKDDLSDGTDYVDVIDEIRSYCSHHKGNTLEHLAHKLAKHIKDHFNADTVELILDKPRYTGKLELSAIRFHVRC